MALNEMILNEAINNAAFPIAKALAPDEYEEGLFKCDLAYQHTPLDFAREKLTLLVNALYGFWGMPLARTFFGDLVQWQGDFQNQELWLAVSYGELLSGYFMTFHDTVAQARMRSIIKERNPLMESNERNGIPTGMSAETEIKHIKIIDCAATPRQSIASLAYERIPFIDKVDTKNISSLGFSNPFCSMFEGKADEKLFENSKACIKSSDFWRALKEKRHAKEIRALPQKQPLKDDTAGKGTPNGAGGETKREKKVKMKISDLKEFDYWKPIYTKSKIEVYFLDNRAPIELIPEDFGRIPNGQEPKKWQWLMIILGGRKEEINTSQLQDVNEGLKKIFDTSIRFFSKNEPVPFQVKQERPKFDRRYAANGEYMEERNNALDSQGSFIDDTEEDHSE